MDSQHIDHLFKRMANIGCNTTTLEYTIPFIMEIINCGEDPEKNRVQRLHNNKHHVSGIFPGDFEDALKRHQRENKSGIYAINARKYKLFFSETAEKIGLIKIIEYEFDINMIARLSKKFKSMAGCFKQSKQIDINFLNELKQTALETSRDTSGSATTCSSPIRSVSITGQSGSALNIDSTRNLSASNEVLNNNDNQNGVTLSVSKRKRKLVDTFENNNEQSIITPTNKRRRLNNGQNLGVQSGKKRNNRSRSNKKRSAAFSEIPIPHFESTENSMNGVSEQEKGEIFGRIFNSETSTRGKLKKVVDFDTLASGATYEGSEVFRGRLIKMVF